MNRITAEQMLELRERGMSNAEIARELGCCVNTVRNRIGPAHNKPISPFELLNMRKKGMSNSEIAKELGIPNYAVYRRIGKGPRLGRKKYSAEAMLKFRASGMTNRQIAKKLGAPPITVYRYIGRQGEDMTRRNRFRHEKWISVKDRLPSAPGEYLASANEYVIVLEFEGGKWHSHDGMRYFVDAWMPKPEGYKPHDWEGEANETE